MKRRWKFLSIRKSYEQKMLYLADRNGDGPRQWDNDALKAWRDSSTDVFEWSVFWFRKEDKWPEWFSF